MLPSLFFDLVHRPKTYTVLIIALKDILSLLLVATLAQTTSRTEQSSSVLSGSVRLICIKVCFSVVTPAHTHIFTFSDDRSTGGCFKDSECIWVKVYSCFGVLFYLLFFFVLFFYSKLPSSRPSCFFDAANSKIKGTNRRRLGWNRQILLQLAINHLQGASDAQTGSDAPTSMTPVPYVRPSAALFPSCVGWFRETKCGWCAAMC